MPEINKPSVSIVVVPRDKFSATDQCLDALITHTPEVYELIVVLGGAPEKAKRRLTARFQPKARFIFRDSFLNPPQARNIGLRECSTNLAVLIDNDVFVRAGWLAPLLECQRETNAAMVVPVVLETENTIHTAGNDLYVTYENGAAYAHKELRFHGMTFKEGSNMKRSLTDYGELHCQLVDVKTALDLGVYDENIQEVGECDSGLTWAKVGRAMYFEPKSVVFYAFHYPVKTEDIRFFAWRWDMRQILKSYRYFERKWNMDITEYGIFREFLLRFNRKLGFFPRIIPFGWVLTLDRALPAAARGLKKILLAPVSVWKRFTSWYLGYYEWPVFSREEK